MNFGVRKTIQLFGIIFFSFLVYSLHVYGEELQSTNYEIKGFSFSAQQGQETSTNYQAYITLDQFINDERFNSSAYQIRSGAVNTWIANTPKVQCFETQTAGSTSCEDGDISNGMVALCGDPGCYNRARFEIDTESNPSDTLYSIQITTDVSWASWNYIDGGTFLIETSASHDLNDYLTETSWEGVVSNFNVYGLTPGTQYYLRITALHGDFTESEPGPDANATTEEPSISFDLDIANTGGAATETAAPYSVDLGAISAGAVSTASNLIWMDVGTNLNEGARVFVRDTYTGLYTNSQTYTLASINGDLDSLTGYGLNEYTSSETYLGPLSIETNYGQGGNIVGQVASAAYSSSLYNTSSQPIYEGRGALYVKAKPAEAAPSASDYTDTVIFTVTADF